MIRWRIWGQILLNKGEEDRDQALHDQFNIPTAQPNQEMESKAQELTQIIKDITVTKIAQNPVHQPGIVSLIIQAWIRFKKLQTHFFEPLIC